MAKKMSLEEVKARIHAYVRTTGISWCDIRRERDGDYVRVAFMPYRTLEVEWAGGPIHDAVRAYIDKQVADYQRRRGEYFPISACGRNADGTLDLSQCVKLGG